MEKYNNIYCVSIDDLTAGESPILSRSNYDNMVKRKKINVVRNGRGSGNYALIEYSSMPAALRTACEARYGNIIDIINQQDMNDAMTIDTKARDFYSEYLLDNGKHLPADKIQEYTINASVLKAIQSILNDRRAIRKARGGSVNNLWETVCDTAERMRVQYNSTLPSSMTRLKDKLLRFRRDGYVSLISGKFCNDNTVKITDEAGDFIIALKRSRVPVYTNAQIFEEFNKQAPELGIKQLKSLQALNLFLKRSDVMPLWYSAVHGELAAKQKYNRKHKTMLPQLRDALWYGDGTKVNLYYKAYEKKKLVVRTTSVYEVIDSYSEVLLGYHISDTENYEAQYNAFRMAINKAQCKPNELVVDNQGGHKKLASSDFFKRIAHITRNTAPYSGQSKTIESVFGRFQAQVLHKNWFFTGQNITTVRLESRPNVEFIEENKQNLPTLEELKEVYAAARQEWNNAPHPATGIPRMEMYRSSINPKTEKISLLDTIDMFWLTTQKESTYTSSGITIVVKGRKYTYEILDQAGMPDLKFVDQNAMMYKKYFVQYDPADMTIVRLLEKVGKSTRYVADAQPYVQIHRAIQEQEPEEARIIRNLDAMNKERRKDREREAYEIEKAWGTNPEAHGLNRPRIKGLNKVRTESYEEYQVNELITSTNVKLKKQNELVGVGEYNKSLSNYDDLDDKFSRI